MVEGSSEKIQEQDSSSAKMGEKKEETMEEIMKRLGEAGQHYLRL